MAARRTLDLGQLGAAVSRPGIDPRRWVVLARVREVGYDASKGFFADVLVLPLGEELTALISAPYAGNRFGLVAMPKPDDIVVLLFVEGEPSSRPIVVARLWNAGDPPPTDGSDDASETPTEDVLLRVEAGKNLRVRVSGAGGVTMIADGDGDVVLAANGAGKVKLGEGTLQPAVLGNDLYSWMQSVENRLSAAATVGSTVLAAYNLHTHISAAPASPTSTTSAPAAPAFPTPPVAPDPRAVDTEVK